MTPVHLCPHTAPSALLHNLLLHLEGEVVLGSSYDSLTKGEVPDRPASAKIQQAKPGGLRELIGEQLVRSFPSQLFLIQMFEGEERGSLVQMLQNTLNSHGKKG